MKKHKKLEPLEAAVKFVDLHFPSCSGAILAGSVIRAEGSSTSDLDIVIFDEGLKSAYRESIVEFGWPIEVFAHNLTSYRDFFDSDCKGGVPSLPRMVSEGIIIADMGVVLPIKQEAEDILEKGPEKWTEEGIRAKRYYISDTLDDFIGSEDRAETLFIAGILGFQLHEFHLRMNQQWIGKGKWIMRALKNFDETFAVKYAAAFESFYSEGKKEPVICLADEVLAPYGGRLFDGFSAGKGE
ncbi:nucleotidyltransferase domain-containing protein [Metabacillus sp. GX 13764]|uniref:nucleotidyltransferase domain-containing protein n=1 Tax=Metabacillus kandeliae TaxID=2900151 RepID=UPI001E531CEF|nr:nucleotidyltransferase domain-containing protein [Metabacillus kandeliae]